MAHERERLTFWQQHALAAMIAVPMLAVTRMIGQIVDIGGAPSIFLHSAILVALAFPLQVAGAYASMRYVSDAIPLSLRAVLGCVAVAPIISFLSPLVSWAVGVGPTAVVEASSRSELLTVIQHRYPAILGGYVFLGTLLWMTICFSWWKAEFEERARNEGTDSETDTMPQPTVEEGDARPAFLDRMPFEKRGDVWALSSELHYVRVYTSNGDDLVLMRLADAIQQCGGIAGVQIHRSHWVAREGIDRIGLTDGKMSVTLRNGTELPVSRSNHSVVRSELADLVP